VKDFYAPVDLESNVGIVGDLLRLIVNFEITPGGNSKNREKGARRG
jgi:hypothetical protein